jgi:hypothetical protein
MSHLCVFAFPMIVALLSPAISRAADRDADFAVVQ